MTTRASVLLFCLALTAQADTLILKDGTHVTGRWWSIDASHVHFLVDNQLQHYPRPAVSAVTFGDATLPPLSPAPSTPPPAISAQPPASAAQPARAPTLMRPSGSAPPSAPPRGLSQPEEIGMVYSWNGKVLTPLERNQAVAHYHRQRAQEFKI